MKGLNQKLIIILVILTGALVGFFKGGEAKQKWVFKLKDKYDNRRQMAERKTLAKKGGVVLDDIELAAYHN
jgi:hypothetical protein